MNGLILQPPYYALRGSHNNRIQQGGHYLLEMLNAMNIPTKLLNMDAKDEAYGTRYNILKATNTTVEEEFSKYDFTRLKKTLDDSKFDFILVTCGDMVVPTVDTGSPKHTQYVVNKLREFGYTGRVLANGPFLIKLKGVDTHIYGDCEDIIADIIQNALVKEIHHEVTQKYLSVLPDLTTNNLIIPLASHELDSISSSRGCIGSCKFCLAPKIYKKKMRYTDAWYFVRRLKKRNKKYGVTNFYFTDLLFTANKAHAREICKNIIDMELNITWRCEARVDTLDEDTLKLMKEAGCEYIKLGVESMSNRRLKWMDKRIRVSQIQTAVSLMKKVGIKCVVYILLGGNNFTDEDYLAELELFKALDADKYTVSILNPVRGSKFFKEIKWVNKVTDNVSHLDSNIVKLWGISQHIVDQYFLLELTHRREDNEVRNFE